MDTRCIELMVMIKAIYVRCAKLINATSCRFCYPCAAGLRPKDLKCELCHHSGLAGAFMRSINHNKSSMNQDHNYTKKSSFSGATSGFDANNGAGGAVTPPCYTLGWVHTLCAKWIPNCYPAEEEIIKHIMETLNKSYFSNAAGKASSGNRPSGKIVGATSDSSGREAVHSNRHQAHGPIVDISAVDMKRFRLAPICCDGGRGAGACIQCDVSTCARAMHPYCILKSADNHPHSSKGCTWRVIEVPWRCLSRSPKISQRKFLKSRDLTVTGSALRFNVHREGERYNGEDGNDDGGDDGDDDEPGKIEQKAFCVQHRDFVNKPLKDSRRMIIEVRLYCLRS